VLKHSISIWLRGDTDFWQLSGHCLGVLDFNNRKGERGWSFQGIFLSIVGCAKGPRGIQMQPSGHPSLETGPEVEERERLKNPFKAFKGRLERFATVWAFEALVCVLFLVVVEVFVASTHEGFWHCRK